MRKLIILLALSACTTVPQSPVQTIAGLEEALIVSDNTLAGLHNAGKLTSASYDSAVGIAKQAKVTLFSARAAARAGQGQQAQAYLEAVSGLLSQLKTFEERAQ